MTIDLVYPAVAALPAEEGRFRLLLTPASRPLDFSDGVTETAGGRIRVVLAKPGLDGHDRGVKIVARALRDAGVEVIYTGLHQTPEQIAETAIQEDADAVGLSCLSGAHMTLFPKVVAFLRAKGAPEIPVFGGGIIPEEDVPLLKQAGIAEIFTPGVPTRAIVDWVFEHVGSDQSAHREPTN